MMRFAIIIGAEKYTHFSPTPFAHADSRLLYSTFTECCDYAVQHTLLLMLAPEADKQPSEILAKIRQTVDNSSAGDTVLFYFAGHGHFSEGRTYLILPGTIPGAYETTALDLEDISRELRPQQRACFRIFDACHSGLDVQDDATGPDSKSFVRAVTHDASGWVTLAACREDEYSVSDPSVGQGVFTYYFSEYIRALKPDEPVLPELLKVWITEKVFEHAKRLGYRQTPTLNASISGNLSLATRRADIRQKEPNSPPTAVAPDLVARIAELRKVPDMFDKAHLEKVLQCLIEASKQELEHQNDLGGVVSVSTPTSANNIPGGMHRDVVTFVQRLGLQPRHELVRWEEEEDVTVFGGAATLASPFPSRKRRYVEYHIWQSPDLPKSVAIIEIPGDSRCVPLVKVLLYALPLQLTTCLLVSSFREGWPPHERHLELLCHSYKILKPGISPEEAKTLAPFAAERTMEELRRCIASRVSQLEKELQE
jgi:hypothetical protein